MGKYKYKTLTLMDNIVRDVSFSSFDHVVLTPPAREIRQMQFSPRLPYEKKIALDALNYFGSVKIFLKFSRPFWSERNKLPIIYYNSTSRKNGGTGISDDILRIVQLSSSEHSFNCHITDLLPL